EIAGTARRSAAVGSKPAHSQKAGLIGEFVRKWSAKLQFDSYEPWSPWDRANVSRWQIPRSEASPFRLDWTISTPPIGSQENRAGLLRPERRSRRCSLQPVGGPRRANSLLGVKRLTTDASSRRSFRHSTLFRL